MNNLMKIMNRDVSNVCVIGDIHSGIRELESVISQARARGINKFISLGDLVDRGNFPNEVIELISQMIKSKELNIFYGNHDYKIIRHLRGQKVNIANEQELTLKAMTQKSIDIYLDIFQDNPIAIYDPVKRIFLSHAAGGRPDNILYQDYKKSTLNNFDTFNEYLFDAKDKFIDKKYVTNLMYGITNGDADPNTGRPIRLPLTKDINDTLESWTIIFGHIHSNNLFPEGNRRVVCVDYSCSEPGGKLCGLIIGEDASIKEENLIFS
jgi:hypothetical protein